MSAELKERHPCLMVPYVYTFGVVIYGNGSPLPALPVKALREALIDNLPAGTGVGDVTATDHGVYTPTKETP